MTLLKKARITQLALTLIWVGACGEQAMTETPTPTVADSTRGVTTFSVNVSGGYGSGRYAPGDTVYTFGGFSASVAALREWSGDVIASSLTEWSGRFVMPARAVTLAVSSVPVSAPLLVGTYVGTTTTSKTYRYVLPPNPRGLILAFHGTGGSSRIIEKGEGYAITLQAVAAGYGVLAYDAEESVAGDQDGNGKLRWDVTPSVSNVDLANIDGLLAHLRTRGLIAATTPLYAFGMSNGSSMVVVLGSIAAQPELAARFPYLRFRAVVGYCAPGATSAVNITRTPTAWYLCRNDANDEVGTNGNQRAAQHSAALFARGVATDVSYNEAAPLYDERFARVGSIDINSSRAAVQELGANGYLTTRRFLNRPPEQIIADIATQGPVAFPVIARLSRDQQADVADALRETYADHQLFADLARRMLDFFGRF